MDLPPPGDEPGHHAVLGNPHRCRAAAGHPHHPVSPRDHREGVLVHGALAMVEQHEVARAALLAPVPLTVRFCKRDGRFFYMLFLPRRALLDAKKKFAYTLFRFGLN